MKGIIVPLLDHIASAFVGDRHYIFNDNKGTKGNQGCMRLASCRGIFCFGFTVGLKHSGDPIMRCSATCEEASPGMLIGASV